MIGTEFIKGFGLGNQLFCYVTARAIAAERGCAFGTANQKQFANVVHSQQGMYFMDIDLGGEITEEMKASYGRFDDADDRLYMGNSKHDMERGCYISGAKESIHSVPDNTILYGNLQDESYFASCRGQLRDWLHVKPEYDSHEYTKDDLCIINMRGGEYTDHPELYLDRGYWLRAIANMKQRRPDMRFMIVTEDVEAARKVLPEYEAHHFDMGRDYVTIRNARWLILSNSSFAVLPVMTSDTVRAVIAPKYWARHNVSDGFWSSEQNIYDLFEYQDRAGRLFTAAECRAELAAYKRTSGLYARRNVRPEGAALCLQTVRRKAVYGAFYTRKIWRSLERRTGIIRSYGS
ncbi:MAG: glycosyl transferase [Lachnospiraceae bacterium]|jgi:hypothetical protein|nr:glycosyl transferase [Lachnospiraceae bacterium]